MISSEQKTPLHAMHCLLQGFKMLLQPDLRHFIIIPLVLNFLLFGLALAVGIHYFSIFMAHVIPQWLDFLAWLLWPLFGLGYLLIVYFTFTLIANVIASPFYGTLAERTLIVLQGKTRSIQPMPLYKIAISSIVSALQRMGYYLTRAIPLLILFLIPGINLAAPFLWLGFSAWIVAQEYMSYPLEAKGLDFARQRIEVKSMKLGLFSFGGLVLLGLSIPIINILIPPAAVVGATLYQQASKSEKE